MADRGRKNKGQTMRMPWRKRSGSAKDHEIDPVVIPRHVERAAKAILDLTEDRANEYAYDHLRLWARAGGLVVSDNVREWASGKKDMELVVYLDHATDIATRGDAATMLDKCTDITEQVVVQEAVILREGILRQLNTRSVEPLLPSFATSDAIKTPTIREHWVAILDDLSGSNVTPFTLAVHAQDIGYAALIRQGQWAQEALTPGILDPAELAA